MCCKTCLKSCCECGEKPPSPVKVGVLRTVDNLGIDELFRPMLRELDRLHVEVLKRDHAAGHQLNTAALVLALGYKLADIEDLERDNEH